MSVVELLELLPVTGPGSPPAGAVLFPTESLALDHAVGHDLPAATISVAVLKELGQRCDVAFFCAKQKRGTQAHALSPPGC
jgi:hypothetical protein